MADRIQQLRKERGISQEELAHEIGVSRQAVSKWESEQSLPDLDKIIALSDFFEVTTDYILKGIESVSHNANTTQSLICKALYIASTTLVMIGLFFGFGDWNEKQSALSIAIAMMIQAVGIALYFISNQLAKANAPFAVSWLNVLGISWMPCSLLTGMIAIPLFHRGSVAPYPSLWDFAHVGLLAILFLGIAIGTYWHLRRAKS